MVRSFSVKSNDYMYVMYVSSLIRSILALHDLINNKIQMKEIEAENTKKEQEKEAEDKKKKEEAEKKKLDDVLKEMENDTSSDSLKKKQWVHFNLAAFFKHNFLYREFGESGDFIK